jgi:hypothetical protein
MGTMKVTWERTVIAGKTGHEDFAARDETGRQVGRVYRQIGGHDAGDWFWCMNAMGPDINWPKYPATGTEPGKQAAADRVKRVFEACLRR